MAEKYLFPTDLPLYMDPELCQKQDNTTTLSQCEIAGVQVAFGLVFCLLGIAIVVANIFVPLAVWKNRRLRNNYNYIKVSLAIADMFAGLVLMISIPVNMAWVRESTLSEYRASAETLSESAWSIIASISVIVSVEASLFHLMLLSIDRFLAIQCPLWHLRHSLSVLRWGLLVIWITALFKALLPVFIPGTFEYKLILPVLINILTIDLNEQTHLIWLLVFAVPYSTMIFLTVAAGVVACTKTRLLRRDMKKQSSGEEGKCITIEPDKPRRFPKAQRGGLSAASLKMEIQVLKTIMIMITCFTITIVPLISVFVKNIVLGPWVDIRVLVTVAAFVMFFNSLLNVLIYSVRDKKFRETVKSMILSLVFKC